MDCIKCSWLGHSGNLLVCGLILQGGDTVYVNNGKIKHPCPLEHTQESTIKADAEKPCHFCNDAKDWKFQYCPYCGRKIRTA